MTPAQLKTAGYGVSTIGVVLLGIVAWPGAVTAHLTPHLLAGMAASIIGMACRWSSYQREAKGEAPRPRQAAGRR